MKTGASHVESLPKPLVVEAARCLDKAVVVAVDTQCDHGCWATPPTPRILDTAIVAYALGFTPRGVEAVARASRWLERAAPQSHEAFTREAEEWLRMLVLNPTAASPPVPAPACADGPYARRALLLQALGVTKGDDGHALFHSVTSALGSDLGQSLKRWQRVLLLALDIIARSALHRQIPAETVAALRAEQGSDGLFHAMPLLTAVVYLALVRAVPEDDSTQRCLTGLLAAQRPDGTWRFPTFDVWDTSLMVRYLRGIPTFDKYALRRAADFLERTQSMDGGWGCVSMFSAGTALASDNDTTGSVLLALASTDHGARTWPAAADYARAQQDSCGLWTTWQSADDSPVEDVVAHMVAGIRSHGGERTIDTTSARAWLTTNYRANRRWKSDWYVFPSYATAEIAPVVGWQTPESRESVRRLQEQQNEDGSWLSRLDGGPPSPAATGQALAVLAAGNAIDVNPSAVERALQYLVDSQLDDGTWAPEAPFMYGPRPFLAAVSTQAHAMTSRGIRDFISYAESALSILRSGASKPGEKQTPPMERRINPR